MSLLRSEPTTSALTVRPEASTSDTSLAPATTWWLVRTWPEPSITTPEPLPRPARTCTTLGRISLAAASVLPLAAVPAPPGALRCCTMVGPAVGALRSRATTIPAPEAPPARTAAAITAASRGRLRLGPGGRRRQDGTVRAEPVRPATPVEPAPPSRSRVRRAGRARAGLDCSCAFPSSSDPGGQISRENQRRDRAPAPVATSRPSAARYGVTSRCSVRQPMEEPMSAYTSRSSSPLSAV